MIGIHRIYRPISEWSNRIQRSGMERQFWPPGKSNRMH